MNRIYDIGANIGRFTEENIKKYNSCEFILVEANPRLYNLLTSKFKNIDNINIINSCVSDKDNEELDFYICEVDTISSASKEWTTESRFSDNYKYFDAIKVKSITIDSLIETYGKPDYIKIDVEGYESVVISGLKRHIGLLSFEWAEESKDDILKSISHLKSIGYKKFHISYNDNYTFIPNDFTDYDTIKLEVESLNKNKREKWGMIWSK
jgi:FkbM family methyltransferase